jgi:hypothetical protein
VPWCGVPMPDSVMSGGTARRTMALITWGGDFCGPRPCGLGGGQLPAGEVEVLGSECEVFRVSHAPFRVGVADEGHHHCFIHQSFFFHGERA